MCGSEVESACFSYVGGASSIGEVVDELVGEDVRGVPAALSTAKGE